MAEPKIFSYEAMGTGWRITIWDDIDENKFEEIKGHIREESEKFESIYSRFRKSSLVWQLSEETGKREVPEDFVRMLRLYEKIYIASGKKLNPLIGFTLSDLGYDEDYRLETRKNIRRTPDFHDAVHILDDRHIEIVEPVLFDLGALGKGFFVDQVSSHLIEQGITRFLADGSGDIFYRGNGEPIRAGLEHPDDPGKVIGAITIENGALCSSGRNRRKWRGVHHIIDPQNSSSPNDILATWVMADSAALADSLATCLFLAHPEQLSEEFSFEYCLLNKDMRIRRSPGFNAELF